MQLCGCALKVFGQAPQLLGSHCSGAFVLFFLLCVSLGKLLNLSEIQFPQLQNRDHKIIYLREVGSTVLIKVIHADCLTWYLMHGWCLEI